MKWNPNFFIVFSLKMTSEITWPEEWGNQCAANVCPMLREVLNTKSIGSELKWLLNENHKWRVIKDNNVTYEELENYYKADCSLVSFQSAGTMNRARKVLEKMGAKTIVCVESYRNMILQQAHYYVHGKFDIKN